MKTLKYILPVQQNADLAHAIRYRGDGLSIEHLSIQDHKIHTEDEALEAFVNASLALAELSDKIVVTRSQLEDKGYGYTPLLKASNTIAVNSRRGAGNLLIGSKSLLEELIVVPINIKTSQNIEDVEWVSPIVWQNADIGKYGRFTCLDRDLGNKVVVTYVGAKPNDMGIIITMANGQYKIVPNFFGVENYYSLVEVEED